MVSSDDAASAAMTIRQSGRTKSLMCNPYLHLALAVLFNAGAQILLKMGADTIESQDTRLLTWLGISELTSAWSWLGLGAMAASFASWIYALRFVPLGLAFNLCNGIHLLVPLGSWFILHEAIGLTRGAGIGFIVVGLLLLTQSIPDQECQS